MNEAKIRMLIRAEGEAAKRAARAGMDTFFPQTTDATPNVITIVPELWTSGLLEVAIVGKDDLGINGLRAKQIVGYEMGSTLTLDTPVDLYPLTTEITGATFSITNVSDEIAITLTGVASTVINWAVETKLINSIANSTP